MLVSSPVLGWQNHKARATSLLVVTRTDWHSNLPWFTRHFDGGYIRDWKVCDWFCVKVLGPLAGQQGEACARAISEWRESSSVWQCRASVVAFANLASKGDRAFPGFTEMVLDNRTPLLGSQERFVQTDGGWVLRELSNSDEERVIEVEPFAQQPGWVRLATEEEAERLARFLGVELEFIWSNP